jgi:SAM-dependent methyltransferase
MIKNKSCPNKHDFIFSNFEFKTKKYIKKKCKNCDFVFTEPCDGIELDVYDSGHYEVKGFKLVPFLINLPDYIYFIIILKLKKLKKNSLILDFGCGKGFFLYIFKLLGYKNLYGLETSKPRADFSRRLTGLVISEEFYVGGKILDKKFDFISLIHVLEHIPEPFLFLDNLILDGVENGGCVLIEVPNIKSISSLIAKNTWAHFTPHFHTNHFSISSIQNYCIDRDLRYSFVSSFSFYNSAMGMTSALLSIFGYKGSIFEDLKRKNIFIMFSFIIFLPVSLMLEFLISVFTKRGSVIKFIIYK